MMSLIWNGWKKIFPFSQLRHVFRGRFSQLRQIKESLNAKH